MVFHIFSVLCGRGPAVVRMRSLGPVAMLSSLAAMALVASPCKGVSVVFDQPVYSVLVGQTFDVEVRLDADEAAPGFQGLPAGLFSNGWQMTVNSSNASVDALLVPPELDFFGFAPGANTFVGPGEGRAEGNVDQIANIPYPGSLLGTITLTNLAPVFATYPLTLNLFRHFPTEDIFLDGNGVGLDDTIQFGSALVMVVVPEPGSLAMAILAIGTFILVRHARVHPDPRNSG